MSSDTPPEDTIPDLDLRLDDTGTRVYCTPRPGQVYPGLVAASVVAALREAGYGDWAVLEAGVQGLTEALCRPAPAGHQEPFLLAEALDGRFVLNVDPQGLEASLHVEGPRGGRPTTLEQVLQALADKGVTQGVDQEAISALLKQPEWAPEVAVIGRATAPVNGTDSVFESLVPEARERIPRIDDRGRADYRDLGELVQVSPGAPLMRRHHATPGTPGQNLFGAPIPARDGRERSFATRLHNVARDPEDPDLLRATVAGMPVVVPNGVIVEELLDVKQVDLSSGHLNFEGSVRIRGDVSDGMRVVSTGDIEVGGMVEGATLEAGGDVLIRHGVVGQLQHGQGHQPTAVIKAGGKVTARFMENARVEAATVVVQEQLVHCQVTARQSVIVGAAGARKGQIVGGQIRSRELIECRLLGSPTSPHTIVVVGVDPEGQDRLEQLDTRLAEKQKLCDELSRTLYFASEHPGRVDDNFVQRARNTLLQAREDMAELESEREGLVQQVERSQDASIHVRERVHAGVEVHVADRARRINQEVVGGAFFLREGELVFDHAP
ncbi:DUF342 domain-containing protein [Ectothiorhodospira marina]|uniref:Flagellar Assembly Protein A N-terminal region domain-containing protein n=1 Tax=Ectothiorhodospira marina TaxID=1396821 RepID=A0A1H7MCA8_9GAMM|nr:FapA family protein [Ectothiorhodospira marina]SEL08792.1 hypothetical protein SAMN05444515_10943 [Ectothiorhodospira marina]